MTKRTEIATQLLPIVSGGAVEVYQVKKIECPHPTTCDVCYRPIRAGQTVYIAKTRKAGTLWTNMIEWPICEQCFERKKSALKVGRR